MAVALAAPSVTGDSLTGHSNVKPAKNSILAIPTTDADEIAALAYSIRPLSKFIFDEIQSLPIFTLGSGQA